MSISFTQSKTHSHNHTIPNYCKNLLEIYNFKNAAICLLHCPLSKNLYKFNLLQSSAQSIR